jgi:protein-disulfide isomerase
MLRLLIPWLLAVPMSATRAQVAAGAPPTATMDMARIRGAESAATWLVIVGDFTLDESRAFHRNVWPIIDSLFVRPGKLRVAWVNLPGESKASQAAAEVAACAGIRWKFWAAHDAFLEAQASWRTLPNPGETLAELAGQRGADPISLAECLKQHSAQVIVRTDVARARGAGIRKAPGFILGNQVLTGLHTSDEFRAAIERALPRTK